MARSVDVGQRLRSAGDRLAIWPGKIIIVFGISALDLTILGILLAFIASMILSEGSFRTAGLMMLLVGLCDMLDGQVARATHTASKNWSFSRFIS